MKLFKKVVVFLFVLAFFAGSFQLAGADTIKDSIKYFDKGKRYYKREKYDRAIKYFEKSINDCPENSMTQLSMYYAASSYAKSGEAAKAKSLYDKLIKKYKDGYWVKSAKKDLKKM